MVSKQQTYQNKTNPSDNTSHTILQNGVIELPILAESKELFFITRPSGPWGDLRGEKFAPPCRRFSRSKFGADGLVEMQGGWVMSEDMADMLKLFGASKSQIRKNGLGDCPYAIHGSGIFTYT